MESSIPSLSLVRNKEKVKEELGILDFSLKKEVPKLHLKS